MAIALLQLEQDFAQGLSGFLSQDNVDIRGPTAASTPELTAYLSGEMIDPMDWPVLVRRLRSGTFPVVGGRFAACVVDHMTHRAYLVSDYLSQYPLYYLERPNGFAFSTTPTSFIGMSPGFDVRWLHDQIAFNCSPTHRCFLREVTRVPAASICTVNLRDGTLESVRQYAERAQPEAPTGGARQQLAEAIDVFSERLPKYVRPGERPVVGLTGGFDSRTIMSFVMDHPGFRTYTYGVPGCSDLASATATASALGIRHDVVPFGLDFERQLPELAAECLWLSGGLQGVARSTLPYVYRVVSEFGGPVLSGVSGDQIFRGHGNVPDIVSPALAHAFRTGEHQGDDHIVDTLDRLKAEFGPLDRPEAVMGYMTYVVPSEYFVGEAALADNFVNFRTPFCDPEIVRLAHRISLSTLGLSKFSGSYGNLKENYLPANLVALNPRLRKSRIMERPLSAFYRGNRMYYIATSVLSRFSGRPKRAPLENWRAWAAGPLRPLVDEFLSGDTRIGQYLKPRFVREALTDSRLTLRLLSVEMLLTLIDSGWQRQSLNLTARRSIQACPGSE